MDKLYRETLLNRQQPRAAPGGCILAAVPSMLFKALLIVVLSVPACGIAYYYTVSLPAHNKAVLDFEKLKFNAQQEEKKLAQESAFLREASLQSCLKQVEDQYYLDIKSNGSPTRAGRYSLDTTVESALEHKKQNGITACQKRYGN